MNDAQRVKRQIQKSDEKKEYAWAVIHFDGTLFKINRDTGKVYRLLKSQNMEMWKPILDSEE